MGPQESSTDFPDPIPASQPLHLPAAASAAFELLTRRWVPQLLYLLCQRQARFGELAQAVPDMSRRVLMERLRQLDEEGLVHRLVEPGPPTRIIYQVTDLGRGLCATLQQVSAWGERYLDVSSSR
ncbi:winged helix-turn-helix transcriptional regulator [Nonomuraea guangzhouensis]|uniref:Winged helix-turn-helix transcriptional regulator n=1 Tax=Nonomuraea guangzhouensis TaxID=1291555 RepID=A0ABW4GV14_9ACTN|nr:helix-turn-helix domain-containing protein [Nonomuraea guangzhouensis]